MSALENVRVALQRRRGESFDFWRSETVLRRFNEEAMQYLGDVGLTAFADIKAGELPYGRKRALEIATTLALEPELLLLDEPTAGMAQEAVERITAPVSRIARERTIPLVQPHPSALASPAHT